MQEQDTLNSSNPEEPVENATTNTKPLSSPKPPKYPAPGDKAENQCPICHQIFKSKEELTMHIQTVHESPKKKP